jgi:hypothetical protein
MILTSLANSNLSRAKLRVTRERPGYTQPLSSRQYGSCGDSEVGRKAPEVRHLPEDKFRIEFHVVLLQ